MINAVLKFLLARLAWRATKRRMNYGASTLAEKLVLSGSLAKQPSRLTGCR